ncbi:hypothetical protein GDO81_025675 [Engystomops pustulosus]|uniref:Uncharacterized protein n=1 Tax=Engystomops pustulosus TaxID=76066 RepID=A0AAV6Z1D4_ENGPU|nr:hypothetical protein GDO81_025675 [Engystomops pustulosus]
MTLGTGAYLAQAEALVPGLSGAPLTRIAASHVLLSALASALLIFTSFTARTGPFSLSATQNNCQAYFCTWQLFWGVMAPHHAW